MVKTSPIIVGVMEKSVPISDIKKEGFSKTGVESTPTTELDNELQRISDEFIAKEEKAAEEVSPIRAVSEVVTREADILSAFDKQCSKEVHEPSYLSDILKTVGDELKETASDGEGANISETLI